MGRQETVFHGSEDEAQQLLAALENNCLCVYADGDKTKRRITTCPGHQALMSDQGFADRLLYVRRTRMHYVAKEMDFPE